MLAGGGIHPVGTIIHSVPFILKIGFMVAGASAMHDLFIQIDPSFILMERRRINLDQLDKWDAMNDGPYRMNWDALPMLVVNVHHRHL
jgi:hypothetical protein